MKLSSNIIKMLFSNAILLIGNLIIALHLPKILDKTSYGEYRQLLLFISFFGVFHFGYLDGVLLKYSHNKVKLDDEEKKSLKNDHLNFILFQIIIIIIGLILFYLTNKIIILFCCLFLLPINLTFFHKTIYQSIGDMRLISSTTIFYSLLNTILIIIGSINEIKNIYYYLITLLISNLIMLCIFEFYFYKNIGFKVKFKLDLFKNINNGFLILISNLMYLLITSLTSILIQFYFDIKVFATFSVATSLLSMIMILVSAVSIPFFNYLKNSAVDNQKKELKSAIIFAGIAFQGCIYFIAYTVIKILPDYKDSISYISYLLMVVPFLMIINIMVINLYKTTNQILKMLKVTLLIFAISISIHFLCLMLFKSVSSLIIANIITIVIWYFYSTEIEFKSLKNDFKDIFIVVFFNFVYISLNLAEEDYITKIFIYYSLIFISFIFLYKSKILLRIKKRKGKVI